MKPRPPTAAARLGLLSAAASSLVLMATPGCGGPDMPQLLASATSLLARNDHEGAKLQAKTVLQQQPESGPARLLLGRALLAGGDPAGAEAELRRAQALHEPAEAVLPALAQALVAQGKTSLALQLPAESALRDPQAEADFRTELAKAHALAGQRVDAQAAVAQALAAQPGHVPARLLAARLAAGEGDADGALRQVSAVLRDAPRAAEAWLLKADLLLRQPLATGLGPDATAGAVPHLAPVAAAGSAPGAPADAADSAAAAEAALLQAVAAQPGLVAAQQALVTLRLRRGNLAGAKAQWAQMHQAAPRHPQTLLLEAVLAEQAGELPRARELSQLLLRAAPDHPTVLLLAAQVERRLGALSQAEALLARALQSQPQAAAPRLQLAQLQLQTGSPDKAWLTLKPLLEASSRGADHLPPPQAQAQAALGTPATSAGPSGTALAEGSGEGGSAPVAAQTAASFPSVQPAQLAHALALGAQAQLQRDEPAAADALLQRAAALQPNALGVRMALALAQLARAVSAGQPPEATLLAELKALAAADTGTVADNALAQVLLRSGQFDAALAAVDALDAKQPGQPHGPMLRAQIALARQQPDNARRQFEAALLRRPDHVPALLGLARLDLALAPPVAASATPPVAARARLAALVARQPGDGAALRALAEVTARSGGQADEVGALWRRATQAEPQQLAGQLAWVDHLLATRAWRPALEATQAALTVLPEQAELLERQARAQLALGQPQQAVASLSRLAQRAPRAALPQLQLAQAQARAGQPAAAAAALAKAAELAPDEPAVLQSQAVAALQRQQYTEALALAQRLQTLLPRSAGGFVLAGDVAVAQKQWAEAAVAYRQGLALPQPGDSAQRLHAALLAGGDTASAQRLAADWRQRRPNDLGFALYLGDIAMAQAQHTAAEAYYRQVLAQQPQNLVALNNLAYSLALQKKPGGAALAQQALAQAPDAPAMLDTLAFCLAAEGQLLQAVQAQGQAVQAAPDAPIFRLQLARLQLQAGDKPAARAELAVLARLGSGFARQAEVAALLKSAGT